MSFRVRSLLATESVTEPVSFAFGLEPNGREPRSPSLSDQDDLLEYYENELTYLRRLGADFARRYPKVAGRLELGADECADPHVERLLEAFSFLTARIQRNIDAELPEISTALLGNLSLARLLVELGADPTAEAADEGGFAPPDRTPLGWAVYSNQEEMAAYLSGRR